MWPLMDNRKFVLRRGLAAGEAGLIYRDTTVWLLLAAQLAGLFCYHAILLLDCSYCKEYRKLLLSTNMISMRSRVIASYLYRSGLLQSLTVTAESVQYCFLC